MKKLFMTILLVLPCLILTNCGNDDDGTPPSETSKTYALGSVSDPSISGTAKFIKNTDDSITVELQLSGTPAGGMHPAHIHFNTALESGAVAVTLGTVNGDTGFSTVTFSVLNDDTPITYEDLLDFDGYINVHASAADLGTLVAQGDIGQNELTGQFQSYALNEVDVAGVSGTAVFAERNNGSILATLTLANTNDGDSHPAHIHAGSVENAPGAILYTFPAVNGTTGISVTNITALDDATPFAYEDVQLFDGYINVHLSSVDLGTLVAQGNIGINTLQ